MKKNTVRLFSLLAALAVAGCGDATGVTGDLTEAEAADLANLIFQLGFLNSQTLGTPQAVDGPARVIETFTETVQTTASCPQGGTVGLDATLDFAYDSDTGDSSVDYSITQTHTDCAGQGPQGHSFTLNGNPNVTFGLTADTNVQSTSTTWSGGMNGGLSWESDGGSGSCTVALEYSGSSAGQSASFSMSGTVCGHSISQNYSVG